MTTPACDRRALLAGSSAALLAGMLPGRATAAALPLTTPADNLAAYVKLVGSLTPRMLYTHYQGVLYAVMPGAIPQPLLRFEALGKARWTPQPDGSYLRKSHDMGFFGDLATRQPIDSFANPLNGRETRVLHYKNGRGETLYTTNGPQLPWQGAATGEEAKPFRPDWTISGDEIWVDDEVSGARESWLDPARWPLESPGKRMFIRSTVTSKGVVSELADPGVEMARCTIMWVGLFPWLPWLLMGDRPGFLMWRSVGRKIARPEEASGRILDFIAARQPDYLKLEDPWMDRKNSWIDYTRERSPVAP